MVNVEARLKIKGKNFEILVDVDKALQLKQGIDVSLDNVVAVNDIFQDVKKGLRASSKELEENFGTSDFKIIAEKIIKQGEVVLPTEYRKKEQETKTKQVIEFLIKNAVDPTTRRPHSESRIKEALEQSKIKIKNKPIEQQITEIISELKKIIPITIETKKLKILVPAVHTGKVYGLLKDYKETENWMSNGDLSCIINLPAGLQMDFYDKLNGVTHGSAIVEEVKE
ncbi:MAG: ribosome assembly factor SBDS [Nanoarchaeota archaeon]|nr:ribosome assembly factor SBDS [Nanoarchaeota archaeon]